MSNQRHYEVKASEPVKGSIYEFLLAGQILLDAEPILGAACDALLSGLTR